MRKIVLIGISIFLIFILCSLSYQPIIADISIDRIDEYNFKEVDTMRILYFGRIYNLSHSEEYINDTLVNFYKFNCSLVIAIFIYNLFLTAIRIFKDGFSWGIYEASSELFDFYYKGNFDDNFICVIQIFKIYYIKEE